MKQGMYKSYLGRCKLELTPAYIEERSIPEPNTGCWLWLRTVNKDGYGGFRLQPYPYMSAHRGSFIAHRGPIEEGLTVDHLCRLRCCVNPDHLEAVTHAENCTRRVYSDYCPKGHLRDGIKYTRNGRYCKQCSRDAQVLMKVRRVAMNKLIVRSRQPIVSTQPEVLIQEMANHLYAGVLGGLNTANHRDVIAYLYDAPQRYHYRLILDHFDAALLEAKQMLIAYEMSKPGED